MRRLITGNVKRGLWRVPLLLAAAMLAGGCAYMHNRLNDASDCVELGVTVSDKPGIAVFTDCYSILPVGFSHIEDAKLLGWGNRQIGMLDFEHQSWGVLVMGSYMQALGEFDPRDPHVVSRKHADDAVSWPRFDMGVIGLLVGDNGWRPFPAFFECDKSIHLGWIGLHLKYRWLDLADFALGWTTLDFMGDDVVARERNSSSP